LQASTIDPLMAKRPLSEKFPRLPNAPLAEVVFELRWALQGEESLPPALKIDPGFPAVVDAFTDGARALGFPAYREMQPIHQTGGWGVFRRHYVKDDQPFPILQIGPGIFAVNQSSEYQWDEFRDLALTGLQLLTKSYPRMRHFGFSPTQIELRYIDAFDKELIGTVEFFKFVADATSLQLALPEFLAAKPYDVIETRARLGVQLQLTKKKHSIFSFDLGSGRREDAEIMRLESKVISTSEDIPKLRLGRAVSVDHVRQWLDESHSLTSAFFKSFISTRILEKFAS
jgi:uncharacterized protein (TIGR04255 family)